MGRLGEAELGGAHHADDAAGRPGQDGVLALEGAGLGEAARRLHEVQAHARHLGADLVDVAAQDRREVGVDHGRVAAADELHQRARAVRHADLPEADLAGDALGGKLVRRMPPAMHEDDGDAVDAGREGFPHVFCEARDIERPHDLALGVDAFVGLDHPRVEQLGQDDVGVEQARPVLVGDPQGVAKAAGDDEQRRLALALEQRVGRHRRAHLHALDQRRRHRRVGRQAEQASNALDGRIAVLAGIFARAA